MEYQVLDITTTPARSSKMQVADERNDWLDTSIPTPQEVSDV